FSDFAILYRTNAQSFAFEKALIGATIPYKIVGGVRFYDRREVKDVMAILKLVINPADTVSLERVCRNVLSGIGDVSINKILAGLPLSGKAKTSYARLKSFLDDTRKGIAKQTSEGSEEASLTQDEIPPAQLIKKAVNYFDFHALLDDGTPSGIERIENLSVLSNNALPYETLAQFLEDSTLMSSADEESAQDSITLMTIHAAKGLEFPVVFLVGMEDGLFPSSRSMEESDIEEERRLAYVGMTRAKEKLFLTYAKERFSFGSKSYTSPSRFLLELGYNPYGSADYDAEYKPDTDDFALKTGGFASHSSHSRATKKSSFTSADNLFGEEEYDESDWDSLSDPFPDDLPVFE
ncbi:MAG: 3'-5' exonuclease, partial [Candidatus Saccharibacteria bacterium]|nr:3'-5' exonuclease [Candidatus Saccharibacteria bacterium]